MMSDYPKYDGPVLIIEVDTQKYFLRQGTLLTIGRSNKNDIILNDPTVSRSHAVIRWDSELPLIIDLESTSGLFVDEDRVNSAELSGLHSIKLGTIYLRTDLIKSEGECPTQLEISNKFCREAILAALTDSNEVTLYGERGSKDVVGNLADNKALKRLLIHLEMSRRTGTLSIAGKSGTGTLKYALGKIRSARSGKYGGQVALRKICAITEGTFHFTVNIDVGEASLCISPMFYFRHLSKVSTKKATQQQNYLHNSHDPEKSDDL